MVAQALCAQDIASYFEASFPDGLEMVNQATFIARPLLTCFLGSGLQPGPSPGPCCRLKNQAVGGVAIQVGEQKFTD